jgi:hypothetical protein
MVSFYFYFVEKKVFFIFFSYYRFFGHEFPINRIYIKHTEDIFIVCCQDRKAYVWQMATEHLERVVLMDTQPELLQDADSELDCSFIYSGFPKSNAKKTLEILSFKNSQSLYLLVIQMNTKRLIDEIYNGIQVLTPPTPVNLSKIVKKKVVEHKKSNPGEFMNQLAAKFIKRKKKVGDLEHYERKKLIATSRGDKPDADTVRTLFSSLMSWGLDKDVDRMCEEQLGLQMPGRHISLGLRGYISYFF